ncbi:MAG: 1-acyl-sn-glycerol-3-phosphate acyltransferase [Chloroflexi bacterium]|nr:1-acyl-sn-glycerol-3-phosphate acyltransferase [Chloroflexota bacterium]
MMLTRFKVNGGENVPRQGPVLVVANHLSLADPPLVGFGLGRQARYMAKRELFQSKLASYIISNLGAFPVNRGQLDRGALRLAQKALTDGAALIMFPEGMRSRTGQLGEAFPGSALIAFHSGVPILPVGVTGSERIKGLSWILRRPTITLNIGPTFHLPPTNGRLNREELKELSDFMMGRIAELLPDKYQRTTQERT